MNNAQTRDSGIHYVNPTQRPATIYWAGKVYISTKVLRNLLGITINILRYMFNFDKYWFQKNIYNTFWNQINSFRYCFVNQPILVCETLLRKPDTRPVYEIIRFANFANWNHSVCKMAYLCRSIYLWNNLDTSVKESKSLHSFKFKIKQILLENIKPPEL